MDDREAHTLHLPHEKKIKRKLDALEKNILMKKYKRSSIVTQPRSMIMIAMACIVLHAHCMTFLGE